MNVREQKAKSEYATLMLCIFAAIIVDKFF
jgi:hypothetical protein